MQHIFPFSGAQSSLEKQGEGGGEEGPLGEALHRLGLDELLDERGLLRAGPGRRKETNEDFLPCGHMCLKLRICFRIWR